jgi:penicillin-binding protein 2
MRGTIYDKNMIPLAYDQLSYNIQFYRDPSKSSSSDRAAYTQSIYQTILLIESNGKSTLDPDTEFWLRKNDYGQWEWNFRTDSEIVAETRENQWRGNFYLSNRTRYPVEVLFETLCTNYAIPQELDETYKLKILAIWQASRMNNYNSTPVTIAYDVGFETVAELEVRSL